MEVILNNNLVNVIIIYKNNKNIYFRFNDNMDLVVTASKYISENKIKSIINENAASLAKMYVKVLKKQKNDEAFYYLGEKYTVFLDSSIKKVSIDGSYIMAPNLKKLNKFYNDECLRIFTSRMNSCMLMFDNLPKFTLKIRKMKTRWGVNNRSSMTITLNSELLKKDVKDIDYVIIHELCHFKYPHHQASFWEEVSKYCPYYKIIRKELRGA